MRDQIISTAEQLIQFKTVKDNPSEINDCLEFCKAELAEYTIIETEHNHIPSILITNTGKQSLDQHFRYLLNGHIDVVAGKEELFKPQTKNGTLYGRGAADMKSSVAVMLETFKTVASKVEYPLALQLVADEEIGGFDGTLHQTQSGVTADFVIVGEKTDFCIETAAKGVLWIELKTVGSAAHGAYLWEGNNAITAMGKNIAAISTIFPVPTKEVWETTCNISKINAGSSLNQVPDQCTCSLDIRRVPEDPTESILAKIKDVCVPETEIGIIFDEPSHFVDTQNKDLQRLRSTINQALNSKPGFMQKHGGSDARHYMHKNIPAVCFGPIGGELHSEDEWVDIDSLVVQAEILEKFLSY